MASVSLKAVAGPRALGFAALQTVCDALGGTFSITDTNGKTLLEGVSDVTGTPRTPVLLEGAPVGYVLGPAPGSAAIAGLLAHMVARESENRSLAGEVLHLYREVHLIEQLSEQLAALLNVQSVAQHALQQAQRLITATHAGLLVYESAEPFMRHAAAFSPEGPSDRGPLGPESRFVASVLERGIAEIVNQCGEDQRILAEERHLHALICAPLRAGQRTVGVISLADARPGAAYTAGDLKLLNTIALQVGAAIANSILCAEMVEVARARAAFAAEMQAVSTVQQLLLQSASGETPGFQVESTYLPASEVGGDFFLVTPTSDGSLMAIVGDVSGKGLSAAMRVATILGALRSESSSDPSDILAGLNNALIAQGELGFTTACCVRIEKSGEFVVANAGHIAPYVDGTEIPTHPSLPLGLVPDERFETTRGTLSRGQHMVLLSDGVPEARDETGSLLGFAELARLTCRPVEEIAETARAFGQEDDITVVAIGLDD